jgi:type III secretory pathway lipoprotein EscJ
MFVDLSPLHLVRRFFKHLCASLLVASLAACGGGQVDLLSAIPEDDANEVIAVLINEGIQATKVAGKEGMVGVSV